MPPPCRFPSSSPRSPPGSSCRWRSPSSPFAEGPSEVEVGLRFLGFIASFFVVALAGMGLSACEGDAPPAAPPPAAEAPLEATGHYCGMLLSEHAGPKGQIHLASRGEPLWFTSVRDTIAFLRLPEEPRDITAIYVNDMGRAQQWDQPGPGTWIRLEEALLVIESDRVGGMGAPEAVPFSDRAAAEAYVGEHGGRILRLAEIPDDYVLGPAGRGQRRGPCGPRPRGPGGRRPARPSALRPPS